MKSKPLPLLAAVLMTSCLLLMGCGGEPPGEPPAETAAMEQDEPAMTLENTDWILVELGGESVEADVPLKAPTLRFDSETGMVAGNSGVNQYGGGYTLTDGVLAFGPMRSTMMAGPPEAMALEQAFLAALSGQKGWRILEGRFELLEADKVTAVFVVAPAPARAVVSGTVSYREKIRLRPGSVLEVTLEAISKQDVKAEVLASFRQEDPAGPPFAFELKYDPAVIDPRFTYSVRARITRDGKLIFTSDTIHPVITRDHGNQVEIPVIGVGGTE